MSEYSGGWKWRGFWLAIGMAASLCAVSPRARAEMEIDAARVKEIAAMLPAVPAGLGETITNRAAWDAWAQDARFKSYVSRAEALAKQPMPELPDEVYLDFSKTGNRARCEKVLRERMDRVVVFALAECLDDKGRFLEPLTNSIDAVCGEKSWTYPAHDRKLDVFSGRSMEMDLRAVAIAWNLASATYMLGDKLPAATRQLILENVRRRVLQPFKDMVEGRRKELNWLRVTNNWNAVCLAGITGAALALEDSPAERAWYIAAAQKYVPFFLKSFTPDGYCSEGVGYWNYGFGHFLMMGETVRQATGGRIDMLADPTALQPALFCRRAEIVDGIYPTIADCHPGSLPDRRFVQYLGERFNWPDKQPRNVAGPAGSLFEMLLFTYLPTPLPPVKQSATEADSPLRTWFKDGGVLISRSGPESKTKFAVALKGGHNAENHNHNDVGSYSVLVGGVMVICDPGGEVYTARTFSPHRYDSKVLNSFGHDVPRVDGKLQRTGASARAVVDRADFKNDRDTLVLNLTSAYAGAGLDLLERTFDFQRTGPGSLTVRDQVEFQEPKTFETALVTWGTMKKISDSELVITDKDKSVHVEIDAGEKSFSIQEEIIDEDVPTATKPRRIGIALDRPVKSAAIVLTITPVTK